MLLSVPDAGFASEHAEQALDDFAHWNDILCDDFISAVILQPSQDIDIAAVATRLCESRRFQSIYTASTHAPLPQGPYFIHGKSIHEAWKLNEDDLDAFVVPTTVDDVTDPTRYAAARLCSCPRALTPCPTQFLRTPSRFAARHLQEHRRAKSTVLDPEQREAVGWGSC